MHRRLSLSLPFERSELGSLFHMKPIPKTGQLVFVPLASLVYGQSSVFHLCEPSLNQPETVFRCLLCHILGLVTKVFSARSLTRIKNDIVENWGELGNSVLWSGDFWSIWVWALLQTAHAAMKSRMHFSWTEWSVVCSWRFGMQLAPRGLVLLLGMLRLRGGVGFFVECKGSGNSFF